MAEEGAELEWEVGEAPERVLTKEERERRALFALMRPVASAAFELRAPLDWLKGAIQTATFAAGRSRGAGLREVGEALDVSISKVALLSRDFKQGMFGSDEGEALELHIERMLSAEPLTLARLNQVLPETSISEAWAMPRSPASPEPRTRCSSTVSAWSSWVWPRATASAPCCSASRANSP